MSRVINFLSGNSATFNTGIGQWTVTGGSAALSATGEKQKLSTLGSLKISPTTAGSVVVSATQSIPADYLGWKTKFSFWAYSEINRFITTTLTVTNDQTPQTNTTLLQAGIWSLIVVEQPATTTSYGSQGSCTLKISLAAAATLTPVYISAPVLSTPNAIVYNTYNTEIYANLPEYIRTADGEQTNPDVPLLRFLDVAFMETADLWDLWESIRYIAPDEYGVAEETSSLVDPNKAPTAWLYWLAMILGFKFQISASGFSSWGSLLTALDADSSGSLSWNELLGMDGTATWSELEAAAPNNTGVDADLRWQVASGVYGINAGTKSAVMTAVKHVLTGTQQVAINNYVNNDPWKMEIVTITSETPDVVGGSSPTVLEAAFAAVPVGYEVTHRCVSAGELILEQAVLWLDAKYSTVSETTMVNRGTAGSALNATYGSGASAPVVVSHTGTNHLYFPGTTGNYATIADNSPLDISGNIDVLCHIAPLSWAGSTSRTIISKWQSSSTQSFRFYLIASGQLGVDISTTGTNAVNATSSTFVVPAANEARWVRFAVDTSAQQVQFFSAPSQVAEPSTWTWTQTLSAAGASVLAMTTANLEMGSILGGASFSFSGKMFRTIIKSGIGASATVVADSDFTQITTGDQQTWPLSGTAASVGSVFSGLKNLGTGADSLNGQIGSQPIVDTNDPVWLRHTGTNYLFIPSSASATPNYSSIPHNASFIPTTSISYRFGVALEDWTPSTIAYLGGHYDGSTNNRSSLCAISVSGLPFMQLSSDGTTVQSPTAASAFGFADNTLRAVRYDWSSTGPTVRIYTKTTTESTAYADCESDAGWTQFGADIAASVPASLFSASASLYVASYPTASPAIKYYATVVKTDGVTQAAVNFTTGITSGAQATFTESSANAATVTIARAASSYKAVAVSRPCWLFAATDQIRIPAHSQLKFDATESLTAVTVVRQWGTTRTANGFLISGRITVSPLTGWSLNSNSTQWADQAIAHGVTGASAIIVGSVSSSGVLATKGIVLDRSIGRLYSTNSSAIASDSASAVASIENSANLPITVGSSTATNTGTHAEFFGVAIWGRALSAAELQTVSDHYNGTVTSTSTALLQSARVWLDAALSAPMGGIVRATTGTRVMAVTRPVLMFTTNQFLQVNDNELIDFNQSETFTVLIAVRNWNAPASGYVWMSKRNTTGASAGWMLRSTASVTDTNIFVSDGSNTATTTYPIWGIGELTIISAVVDRSTAQAIATLSGKTGTAASISGYGSFATNASLLIGAFGGVSLDSEFLGAAIFAGSLTSTQLDSVVTYFKSSL